MIYDVCIIIYYKNLYWIRIAECNFCKQINNFKIAAQTSYSATQHPYRNLGNKVAPKFKVTLVIALNRPGFLTWLDLSGLHSRGYEVPGPPSYWHFLACRGMLH